MSEPAIELEGVRKRFSSKEVLSEVTLQVPRGETFALLGRNGAGKTTTIRILLGLIQSDAGKVRIMGLDPGTMALEIRRTTGYLAEDQALFSWMRVSQILGFLAPFYPTWDRELAERYRKLFELPLRTRVRNLSKGQKVRLGLLLARFASDGVGGGSPGEVLERRHHNLQAHRARAWCCLLRALRPPEGEPPRAGDEWLYRLHCIEERHPL